MICIFKCVSCGDKMIFSPEKQAMVCPTCGSVCEMDAYDMADVTYEGAKSLEDGLRVLHCPGCGAKVSAKQGNAKIECGYCDAELATFGEGEDTLCPEKIIPMKLSEDDAKAKLITWWNKHGTMPELDLKKLKMSFTDMYAPVWLVYTDAYTDIQAKVRAIVGDVYKSVELNRGIRKIVKSRYERVPFDASCHIQDEQFYNIEPYSYGEMVDFNAGFLSGHMAECYHNGPETTLPRVIGRVKDLAINYCKEDIKSDPEGGDIIDLNHVECDVTPSEIVYLLVPIWVCKYTYHGKKRYVYINGQTGKVDGEVLFANHNYEMNIGMYSVSCFISALSVLLLGTSVFFGGVTSFFISLIAAVIFILFAYVQMNRWMGVDNRAQISVNEEVQLRHGMKVNTPAYCIVYGVVAFVAAIFDFQMVIPRLVHNGNLTNCLIVSVVASLIISATLIVSFSKKLMSFETYIKKTRFVEYIKASETYDIKKIVW